MKVAMAVASILLPITILVSCAPMEQINTEVQNVIRINYDSLGTKNDGSLGQSGTGYSIFVRLHSPVLVTDDYRVGVQTDDGIAWNKEAISDAYLSAGDKWAAAAVITVPSEAFKSQMEYIDQNRARQKDRIASLTYEMGKMTLRALQEGAIVTGLSPADQKRAEQMQAEIDALKASTKQDNLTLLKARMKIKLEQLR